MPFEPTDYLPYDFANRRHIGPSPAEMEEMLKAVGAPTLDAVALVNAAYLKLLSQRRLNAAGVGEAEGAGSGGIGGLLRLHQQLIGLSRHHGDRATWASLPRVPFARSRQLPVQRCT